MSACSPVHSLCHENQTSQARAPRQPQLQKEKTEDLSHHDGGCWHRTCMRTRALVVSRWDSGWSVHRKVSKRWHLKNWMPQGLRCFQLQYFNQTVSYYSFEQKTSQVLSCAWSQFNVTILTLFPFCKCPNKQFRGEGLSKSLQLVKVYPNLYSWHEAQSKLETRHTDNTLCSYSFPALHPYMLWETDRISFRMEAMPYSPNLPISPEILQAFSESLLLRQVMDKLQGSCDVHFLKTTKKKGFVIFKISRKMFSGGKCDSWGMVHI